MVDFACALTALATSYLRLRPAQAPPRPRGGERGRDGAVDGVGFAPTSGPRTSALDPSKLIAAPTRLFCRPRAILPISFGCLNRAQLPPPFWFA